MPDDLVKGLAKILSPQPVAQIPWLFAAEVTRVDDPEELHRIKVQIPARDGAAESDWFLYCSPSPSINLDLPAPGSIAICAYLDGETNQGIWLGVLVNYTNRLPYSPNEGDIVMQPPGDIRLNAQRSHAELTAPRTIALSCEANETSVKLQDDSDLVFRSGLLEAKLRDLIE